MHTGTALVRLYDIPIFMPLWIEHLWRKGAPAVVEKHEAEVAS